MSLINGIVTKRLLTISWDIRFGLFGLMVYRNMKKKVKRLGKKREIKKRVWQNDEWGCAWESKVVLEVDEE